MTESSSAATTGEAVSVRGQEIEDLAWRLVDTMRREHQPWRAGVSCRFCGAPFPCPEAMLAHEALLVLQDDDATAST